MQRSLVPAIVLLGAVVLAGCGQPSTPSPPRLSATPAPTSTAVATVTCDGVTDMTSAIQAAVDAGGKVVISAGTCVLTNRISVRRAVTVQGAGATTTFLVQHAAINIFQITADNVTVSDLNLDTATYNPGPPIKKNPKPGVLFSNSNDTTVSNVTGEAGSGFGMRFTGPNPCSSYQRGGTVVSHVDMTTTGTGGFAAVDIDCQNHARLEAITIHGGILALFNDENVTLDRETFTPGPFAMTCAPPFFITGPAHDITVSNVVSHGGKGTVVDRPKGPAYNIAISNQTADGLGC